MFNTQLVIARYETQALVVHMLYIPEFNNHSEALLQFLLVSLQLTFSLNTLLSLSHQLKVEYNMYIT